MIHQPIFQTVGLYTYNPRLEPLKSQLLTWEPLTDVSALSDYFNLILNPSGQDRQGDNSVFSKFPELPREIRDLVWDFAVPDPRDIPDSILVYVNFVLNKPRAIFLMNQLVEDLNRHLRN
jgi:hypothetical protein